MSRVKKLGTDLDAAALDAFKVWADERKYTYKEATQCAYRLLALLPLELRDMVMRERWDEVREWLEFPAAAALGSDTGERLKRVQKHIAEARASGLK